MYEKITIIMENKKGRKKRRRFRERIKLERVNEQNVYVVQFVVSISYL